MTVSYSIPELARIVGGEVCNDSGAAIRGVADIDEAGSDDATWVTSEKYVAALEGSKAGVVLVSRALAGRARPLIVCDHPPASVARLLGAFAPPAALPEIGIHPTACVDETAAVGHEPRIGPHVVVEAGAVLGDRCCLHAGVFIGRDSRVGDDAQMWPGVVIRERCVIGHRVVIHPNAVIGADGFGFYFAEGAHHKVPHGGGVRIGDDVEIGACTCIDRSKFGSTTIGNGVKIDNLVHIAHNVRFGDHSVVAALSVFGGSTRVGRYCLFGGRIAAADNIVVGDRVTFTAADTFATKNIPDGAVVSGMPARDHRQALREQGATRKLPELIATVKKLTRRIESLEAAADNRS